MYTYIQSEYSPDLYTVGFYTPDGKWIAESDHTSKETAAQKTAYLNGGGGAQAWINQLREENTELKQATTLKHLAAFRMNATPEVFTSIFGRLGEHLFRKFQYELGADVVRFYCYLDKGNAEKFESAVRQDLPVLTSGKKTLTNQ